MNPTNLPSGTVIRVNEDDHLERMEHGWSQVNAHCVDCGADWTLKDEHAVSTGDSCSASRIAPDGLDALLVTEGSWTVVSVPAGWLAVRLTLLLANATTDVPEEMLDAIKDLGIDAGLS